MTFGGTGLVAGAWAFSVSGGGLGFFASKLAPTGGGVGNFRVS
jgi:hypothetical protein